MFPTTFCHLVLLVVLVTLAFQLDTTTAEEKSDTENFIQTTLLCVLDKGLLTSKNCTDAVTLRYTDVEFPELLCKSLHFFLVVYPYVGCKHEDFITLSWIFCKKNLTCTYDHKTEIIAVIEKLAITESPVVAAEKTKITEQPAPRSIATTEASAQQENYGKSAACVLEEMLSSKKCKQFFKIQTKKFRTLSRGCEALKRYNLEKFNCSHDDKDLLNKVLCDNISVLCLPQNSHPDPAQVVADTLKALISDFPESCKATVETLIDDFVQDKDQACETIDDDLDELCTEKDIFKIKSLMCIEGEKP